MAIHINEEEYLSFRAFYDEVFFYLKQHLPDIDKGADLAAIARFLVTYKIQDRQLWAEYDKKLQEQLPHIDMKSVFEILGLFHQEGYGSPQLFRAINEVIKA